MENGVISVCLDKSVGIGDKHGFDKFIVIDLFFALFDDNIYDMLS